MLRALSQAWRLVATGLCFAVFGLGSAVFSLTVLPWLCLLIRSAERRTRLVRLLVHYFFRGFIGLMRGLGVLSYEIAGIDRLRRQGLLIVANHPSLIDVVFLISLVRCAGCVVKGSLKGNRYLAGAIWAADYICSNEGQAMLDRCVATVQSRQNLIIFPEGTRASVTGATAPLGSGAARVAVRGRTDITPVLIACHPAVLQKGAKWYAVPASKPHFWIRVQEDIPVLPFVTDADSEPAAARQLTAYLTHYFNEVQNHE